MAQTVRSGSQEYWRPANPDVVRLVEPTSVRGTCWRCGIEYSPRARFCHICGSERDPRSPFTPPGNPLTFSSLLDLSALRRHLGLSQPSLVLLALAVICAIAAVLTGAIYATDTLADWQAVQVWRIEWLLAATVALLAAILLKRKTT